jgi:release factor glutamine methyltransferase
MTDREILIQDKYAGNAPADELEVDIARLAEGEPLAYVIGWIPILGLRIHLDSRPLIPRPETEWWTNELITHIKERFGDNTFHLLDLCAGSGAIGLAILHAFPNAQVSFSELETEHAAVVAKNIAENNLDASRAAIYSGDLFSALPAEARFNIIATNPPYIPSGRTLDDSVRNFEPPQALFAGAAGLSLITRIAAESRSHLLPDGELWMECDIENVGIAKTLVEAEGAERAEIRTDQYGRERFVVAYYS